MPCLMFVLNDGYSHYANGMAVGLMKTETSDERFYSSPSDNP